MAQGSKANIFGQSKVSSRSSNTFFDHWDSIAGNFADFFTSSRLHSVVGPQPPAV